MPFKYEVDVDDKATAKLRVIKDAFSGLDKPLKGLAPCVQQVNKNLGSLTETVKGLGFVYVTKAIWDFGKSTLESADEMGKFATSAGVSVEALAGMKYSASLAGLSYEGLQKVVKSVSEASLDAATGAGENARLFKLMGVNVTNAAGEMLPANEIMYQLSDRFAGMKDGSDKVVVATKLFGKQWKDTLPFLQQGGAAMRSQVAEGGALLRVTGDNAAASERFNDSLEQMAMTLQGDVMAAITAFKPELDWISGKLSEMAKNEAEKAASEKMKADVLKNNNYALLTLYENMGKSQFVSYQLSAGKVELDEESVLANTLLYEQSIAQVKAMGADVELAKLKANLQYRALRDLEGSTESTKTLLDYAKEDLKIYEKKKGAAAGKPAVNGKSGIAAALAAQTAAEKAAEAMEKQVENARKLVADMALEGMSDIDKLFTEYRAKLASVSILNGPEKDAALKVLESWYDGKIGLLRIKDEEMWQTSLEGVQRASDEARAAADQRMALWYEVYSTEKENEIRAVKERSQRMESAGIAHIDIVAWEEAEIEKIRKKYRDQDAAKEDEALKKKLEAIDKMLGAAQTAAGSISGIVNNLSQTEINDVNSKYDAEKQRLDELYSGRIEGAQGNADAQSAIQSELANKEKVIETKRQADLLKIQKSYAAQKKAVAISEALIEGALGASKIVGAYALMPPVMWPLLALQAALTASQVALISSQKFAKGGYPSGKNALVTVNENGQEFISNSRATSQFSDILEAANKGATRQDIASMIGKSGRGDLVLTIQGGIIDDRFLRDSLVPALDKFNRRR